MGYLQSQKKTGRDLIITGKNKLKSWRQAHKILYLHIMKKTSVNKNSSKKRKVLATKKASFSASVNTPLRFKLVTEAELKAARNHAYSYLVK